MSDVRFGAHLDRGPDGFILVTITKSEGDKITVLQIGAEMEANLALTWGAKTIELIRSSGDDQAHVPDYFERRGIKGHPLIGVQGSKH